MSLSDAVEELIDDTGTRPVLKLRADDLSSQQVGEVLLAAHLGRKWLETVESLPSEKRAPLRCFIAGYLIAMRDRT